MWSDYHSVEAEDTESDLFAVRVVEHGVHDVLGQFGLIGIGGSAHPGVHDALVVGALKGNLQNTCWVMMQADSVIFFMALFFYY